MQSPQTPGVYYERVDASAPAISSLRTDIAGFVGIATRGPAAPAGARAVVAAVPGLFRRLHRRRLSRLCRAGFFENGGRRCWVVRVASEVASTAALTLQSDSSHRCLDDFRFESRSLGQRPRYRDQRNASSADLDGRAAERAGILHGALHDGIRPRHSGASLTGRGQDP